MKTPSSLSGRILTEGAAIGNSIYRDMRNGNRKDARATFRSVTDPDRLACAVAQFLRRAQDGYMLADAIVFLDSFAKN